MDERYYWRITYLPAFAGSGECEWVFKGTHSELNKYLLEKHGCSCEDCKGKDWWETAQSREYIVEKEEHSDE